MMESNRRFWRAKFRRNIADDPAADVLTLTPILTSVIQASFIRAGG
jgi:hypothetical protein